MRFVRANVAALACAALLSLSNAWAATSGPPLRIGSTLALTGPLASTAAADTENNDEKRKARYKPDSAQVKTFYRVNRYPS